MAFGAFENTYNRYLSEAAVRSLLEQAEASDFYRDVLGRHLKAGLFNYQIDRFRSKNLVGLLHFRHFDILTQLTNSDWSVQDMRPVIEKNFGALSNTVAHQPYEEFAGLLKVEEYPMTVEQLREHTGHLGDWMGHLRRVYKENKLQSGARKTVVAIALDLLRLIQAIQENTLLDDSVEPFARASITDMNALLETLHNTLISLCQEGVIRYQLPPRLDWARLLDRPDLAACCSPDGYFVPVPSINVFEDVSVRSGQPIPQSLLVSPDSDALLGTLTENDTDLQWALLTLAPAGVQVFIVQSPIEDNRYSVFAVMLDLDMVTYIGDLTPDTQEDWGDLLITMVDQGSRTLSDVKDQMQGLS